MAKQVHRCRVTIKGTFRGEPFEYTDPEGAPGSQFIWSDGDPSTYWWQEGNMACDCNRARFVPSLADVADDYPCGAEILIDSIVPLDPDLPALILNESEETP